MRCFPRHHVARPTHVLAALIAIVALLALTVRPALAGFQPQQTFPAGSNPYAMAVADLNGDGKPDLATASNGSTSVSVLLNTTADGAGPPTFATAVHFVAGGNAWSMAAADLNGDGKPDLAVANRSDDTVRVLLNTTAVGADTPTFATQVAFGTGPRPQSVALADLNGDGRPDLAVANSFSSIVSVLLNTTAVGADTPTFATQVTFQVEPGPQSVAVADLNGDGKPDLVTANNAANSAWVSVLLNTTAVGDSTPTFATQVHVATAGHPWSVAVADLNGDGRPDFAITNTNDDTVSVLLNTTTGAGTLTFATRVPFDMGGGTLSVAAADLNGDGKPDLAVPTGNAVSVLLNTMASGATTPTFAPRVTFATGINPRSVAAADLNGDGRPDLAVANSGSHNVSVLLGNPSGALQFSGPVTTVAEGAGAATVTLARTGSTDGQVSAIVSMTGGTATPGQDFTPAGPQTVTWLDGDGANKILSIPILQDQIHEGDETLQLSLTLPTNPFGATLGAHPTSILTIGDDDPLVLSIANASLPEGNGGTSTATFTVTRTGSTLRTATVQYATADGSAKAGSDYTATSGTLTFTPNEASRTIAVPILGDTLAEPDETFVVTLANPTNAVLGIAQAVGIILNDDGEAPRALSIASVSLPEGNSGASNATFTVTRTGSLEPAATVQYATADGSATAGSDYTATGGTLTFASNQASRTIAVPILGDALPEPAETFTVTLSNPTNAVLGIAQAIGVIQNDDGDASPFLSIANASQPEGSGAGNATFTVTRTGSLSQTVTVAYATADGSARAGSDYAATNGTLTFAPSEASKTIAVQVQGDTLAEPDETFTLTLTNPTNATLGVAQAIGVIQNDDVAASTSCTPHPRVTQTLAAGGGALNVHVESTPLNSQASNLLRQIKLGALQNATVTLNGQPVSSGQTVMLPANTVSADLVVRRVTAGQSTTVPFTVGDGCGEWQTFVGGGSGAGF